MQDAHRTLGKQTVADITGHPQAMRQIIIKLLAAQRVEVILKGDALTQLAHRFLIELFIELGLAKQHHLQQLALFRFQIIDISVKRDNF